MLGTLINVVAIIAGSLIGLSVGNRLPKKMQESVVDGLGFTTLIVAISNALVTKNIIVPLLSIAIGAVIGELLNIDGAFQRLGGWLQTRFSGASGDGASAGVSAKPKPLDLDTAQAKSTALSARARFITGFVTASLLFCVGPLTILGSVRNGMNAGDIQLLAIKSTLDFFASMAFSASLGVGVMFSIIPIIVIQGGLALVGVLLGSALNASGGLSSTNPYVVELTATGGLILIGIALTLLDLKRPRVSNFLPALIIAPLIILILTTLGINYVPG